MGDIWIESGGIYHPVNVKTGETDKNGQPNMVSMKKLLSALIMSQIDSYYLLFVKMIVGPEPSCSVYFVDMLDYLGYVTFDSGPGQIMLKERQFFDAVNSDRSPPALTTEAKVVRLFDLLKDGEARLIRNRARVLAKFEKQVGLYIATPSHTIDQSGLQLA